MDKQKELEELQKTLGQIYLKNIEFFKKNHIDIYEKIVFFENQNIENYSLEFINDEFGLIDLKTKQNLYKKEPFGDSLNRVNNFSLSNAFTLINLDKIPKRGHYEDEINSYMYLNEYIENFENIDLKVEKFIFIGTLLGVHLNDFHKSLNAKSYLIIEPNIEIFKLSLFLCDYEDLSKNSKLFFAIFFSEFELEKITKEFLNYKYELNSFIHFETIYKEYSYFIEELQNIFVHNSQMRYPFHEFLISLKRGYKQFFQNKKPIINLSKKHLILKKKILFLGAGVSLAKNLEWVYLNQDKFIIVASSAVLKHLRILEIIPDIILAIDGQKIQMETQFDVDEKMYKNSIILASIKLDLELSLKLKDTKIFFMQNALELFSNYGFLSGVTVGDVGVDILAKLGAKEIYLLGIDAAVDSKSGKTHVGTHKSSRKLNLNAKNSGDFREDIIYIKGNFEEKVPTFREYIDMINSLKEIIYIHSDSLKVYNLGTGAFFEGSYPFDKKSLNISNFKTIDKQIFANNFLKNLQNISKNKLDKIDINDISKEKKILKKLNSIKIDNFYKEFQIVFKNYPNSMICNIFDRFFKLILPYCNILENSKKNEILQNQICEVLGSFNDIFEQVDTKF